MREKDRSIYNTVDVRRMKMVTVSAAQGSILSCYLPNVLYDEIFHMDLLPDTYLIGYADEIVARDVVCTQRKLDQIMRTASSWMAELSLTT